MIWSVLYPILLYYAVSGLTFFGMTILLGDWPEIYMVKQLVCSASALPFLLSLWKQDRYIKDVVYGKQEKEKTELLILRGAAISIGMLCFGVALNNFIAMTPLIEHSSGFHQANEAFFSGKIAVRIVASCLVVPIAEEILFRGIVLQRIARMAGIRWGIFFSAVLFGIVHANLVQFVYAALLGMVLAIIAEETGRISFAVLGHAAANLIAIIRTETGVLDFSYKADAAGILFSALMLLTGAGFLYAGVMKFHQRK